MVMPLDLFVTPYTPVDRLPSAASGYKSLGEFGQQLSERAYREKKFGEEQRQFDVEAGRRAAADKTTAKYHDDLIDARKEASRDAAGAKRDARVSRILDMMRKAQDGNRWDEVASLREELTRMGYATEESDTAFAPEAPAAKATLPPDVPSPKIPTAKVPKVDPKFAGALKTEMGKEDSDTFGLGGPSIEAGDPEASPFPWEGLGMPAPPKKKGPGGRFTVKDPQGNIVSSMDVPMEKEKDRQGIEATLAPYIDDPQNPESQGAAKRASEVAQRAIQTGMSPDKAMQLGLQSYKTEMQRYKAQKLPSAQPSGGGPGGPSKQEQQHQDKGAQFTLSVVKESRYEQAVKEARVDESKAEHALGLINASDPFSNRVAMMEQLHAWIGSAQTRTELENALGGAGAVNKLQMDLNNWTSGGEMPEPIRRGFQRAGEAARAAARKRIEAAAQGGAQFIRDVGSSMSPEERERNANAAANYLRGTTPAPSSPDRKSLDDETRKMLKGYK